MRLIGKIDRGGIQAVFEHHMAGHGQRGEVGHAAAAYKQTSGLGRKSASIAEPVDYREFGRGRTRAADPGSGENVVAGSQSVSHGADEIAGARDVRQETWMVHVHAVAENLLLQLRQDSLEGGSLFRGRLA